MQGVGGRLGPTPALQQHCVSDAEAQRLGGRGDHLSYSPTVPGVVSALPDGVDSGWRDMERWRDVELQRPGVKSCAGGQERGEMGVRRERGRKSAAHPETLVEGWQLMLGAP